MIKTMTMIVIAAAVALLALRLWRRRARRAAPSKNTRRTLTRRGRSRSRPIKPRPCKAARQGNIAPQNRIPVYADWLPDGTPVRSLCPRMVCTACGLIGADVRPDWSAHTNRRPSWTCGDSLAPRRVDRLDVRAAD
jgi:hypothetical protein